MALPFGYIFGIDSFAVDNNFMFVLFGLLPWGWVLDEGCVFNVGFGEVGKGLVFFIGRAFGMIVIPRIELNGAKVIEFSKSLFHESFLLFS